MKITVNVQEITGTQMAAKIVGNFIVDENSFPFTGIAFGRIGGQNIGVKTFWRCWKKTSKTWVMILML